MTSQCYALESAEMNVQDLNIPDVKLITPRRFGDARGFFMETFKQRQFNTVIGQEIEFVQDNHSFSSPIYTVRGLHYQSPPRTQGKLVRCTRGRILDVAVDVRKDSSTFGQHVKAEISAENGTQIWVPAGFLHGFVTLEPNTEVLYKCTDYYAPEYDGNVFWNDPNLDIGWGFDVDKAIVSAKDADAPMYNTFDSPF